MNLPTPHTSAHPPTIHTLHQHLCTQRCPPRWSPFPTPEAETRALDATLPSHAIIRRLQQNPKSPTGWSTASFTINSPAMREALSTALANYQDLDLDLNDWTFAPPYMPLVHRWDAISRCDNAELLEFLTEELKDMIGSLKEVREKGKVKSDELWKVFPPGELVVFRMYGVETVGRIVVCEARDGVPGWELVIEYVEWSGKECGFAQTSELLGGFTGVKRVTDLAVHPVVFRDDGQNFAKDMIARGRKWEALRGFCFREYQGRMVLDGMDKGGIEVSGRVVIDAYAFYRSNKTGAPVLTGFKGTSELHGFNGLGGMPAQPSVPCLRGQPVPLPTTVPTGYPTTHHPLVSGTRTRQLPLCARAFGLVEPEPITPSLRKRRRTHQAASPRHPRFYSRDYFGDDDDDDDDGDDDDYGDDEMDGLHDGPDNGTPVDRKPVSIERKEDLTVLSDEQCMLANPWVLAMDLKTKQWGYILVDNVTNIAWNEKSFENLVLPGGEKDLAWDFVESKAQSVQEHDNDFVEGKGRGIIILMFGPSGVGKTYTAEAVSERARVPLYSISAGTLGTSPKEVEDALDHALDLCRMWNAMLLLDEADVFLGTRTNDGLTRNELVSIFLTRLEYYQGILFLTTNRITSIDHAFRSRVDLFLPYKDLETAARRQIWENFIKLLGGDKFSITEADLVKLSKLKLNGREIKNLIKTAQMLGYKNGGVVAAEKLYMLAEKRVEAIKMFQEQGHGERWGQASAKPEGRKCDEDA
ncbi:hypothetical protein OQA88_801 [Cercophora sp. LCS_1]